VPKGLVIDRLTPRLVKLACEMHWEAASDNKKGEWADAWIREDRRRQQDARHPQKPRPKSLRESGFPRGTRRQ
jgi:hypothetical protein